jgi:hypothetical protein
MVHSVHLVLAAGSVGAGALSDRLAVYLAVPASGNRGARRFCTAERALLLAGSPAAGSANDLRPAENALDGAARSTEMK